MENLIENTYIVFIRIASNNISISISDENELQISTKKLDVSLQKLSVFEIGNILQIETNLNCKTVRIVCESESYTFVPAQIFKPEEASLYLNFQHKNKKTDPTFFNIIPTKDIVNVFSVPSNIQQAISQLFPNLNVEHQMSWFLTEMVNIFPENALYIWVRSNMFDLILLQNGRLQILNSFSFQTPEDFVYHTLNVVEQFSLKSDSTPVFLYNSLENKELKGLLDKYLNVVSM